MSSVESADDGAVLSKRPSKRPAKFAYSSDEGICISMQLFIACCIPDWFVVWSKLYAF